jgi:late competence protein required for DNA uptake (superfamily II DNA/RNA helicase)
MRVLDYRRIEVSFAESGTKDNAWSSGRVCILASPRLDLTVDLVTRLKNIFTEHDLLQFDTKSTVCNLNGVHIEAFPSHTGLKSMRGLIDIKMILCDEASFFDINQNQEVIETLERYKSKSDPIIVLCNNPARVSDLMDFIRQQSEEECFYKRMFLSYKVGLNKIYTPEEIEIQKKSLSFEKEYNLSFESGLDSIFKLVYTWSKCRRDRGIH